MRSAILLSAAALGVAAATNEYPTCANDKCYNNLVDASYVAEAHAFCPTFLATTCTDEAKIPAHFAGGCGKDLKAVSSACSCITQGAEATTTALVTPTIPVVVATSSEAVTLPGDNKPAESSPAASTWSAGGKPGKGGDQPGKDNGSHASPTYPGDNKPVVTPAPTLPGDHKPPHPTLIATLPGDNKPGSSGPGSAPASPDDEGCDEEGEGEGGEGEGGNGAGEGPGGELTTSTIWATNVYTVTDCPPSVENCPARGQVTTETVAVATTICPIGQEIPSGPKAPSGPAPIGGGEGSPSAPQVTDTVPNAGSGPAAPGVSEVPAVPASPIGVAAGSVPTTVVAVPVGGTSGSSAGTGSGGFGGSSGTGGRPSTISTAPIPVRAGAERVTSGGLFAAVVGIFAMLL